MKTIVLGFKDAKANGPAILLAGPNDPEADKIALINAAKRENKFSNGVVRVELCLYEPRTTAIEIPKQTSETKKDKK